jgi:hypothetical protein
MAKKDETGRFLKRKRAHPPPEVEDQQRAFYANAAATVPTTWPEWMGRPELLPKRPPGK